MALITLQTLYYGACASIIWVVGRWIYRAFFDSLSKFPGPKLAAASMWYEFYYDVVNKGQYTWEIKRMHEKYGPIVRINPYEIHIDDPEFLDSVYPGPLVRTEKYHWARTMFSLKTGHFGTASHELHRIRRAAVANFFSKAALQRLEPGVQYVIDKLVYRLEGLKDTGRPVNLYDVFACMTADVISQYSFAESYEFLDDQDFAPHWHQTLLHLSITIPLLKHLGFLRPVLESMPEWLVKIVQPSVLQLISQQKKWRSQILDVKASIGRGKKPEGQTSIFYDVLTNPDVRPQEKTDDHMQDEAQALMAAGTITTAHILTIITFHIISNPSMLQKLQAELKSVMFTSETPPKWQQLEQLPYLTAVITEGLRIGYGVPQRLQRCFPDKELEYGSYRIPKRTPVSMSTLHVHDNPTLFPDPRTFQPERFLKQPRLKKYINSFSRGTRQCLGINLAYAELYLVLAAIFAPGKFKLELFETDISDVETAHDFLVSFPRLDSKGARVTVN